MLNIIQFRCDLIPRAMQRIGAPEVIVFLRLGNAIDKTLAVLNMLQRRAQIKPTGGHFRRQALAIELMKEIGAHANPAALEPFCSCNPRKAEPGSKLSGLFYGEI